MKIILKNKQDLTQAVGHVSWLNRPDVEEVVVELPWIDTHEQRQSAKTLKSLYNDCGCLWGTGAFLITLPIVFWLSPASQLPIWTTIGISLGSGMVASFVGKFSALGWSWWRLNVLLKRLNPEPG